MREFTKSVLSYGWASTMFQVQQLTNVFTTNPETGNSVATDAYNELARATAQQLSPAMQATYRVGDAMQRSMVNMMFGAMGSWDTTDCRDSKPAPGATRQPLRPSWRDPARLEFRRPAPVPVASGPQPVTSASSATQGWGPMP